MKRVLLPCLVLTLGATLLCGSSPAQPDEPVEPDVPVVEASLDPESFHVGDTATLSLTVRHPIGSKVVLPDLDQGKVLRVIGQDEYFAGVDRVTEQSTFKVRFTSYQPGKYTVSTNTLKIVLADGEAMSLPIPFLSYEVVSVLAGEDNGLRDIKPMQDWPPNPWPRRAVIAASGILALLAAAGVVVLIRRCAARPKSIAPPPPADVVAHKALEHLHGKGYIEALLHEPFYVELSDIVRHYLENRFDLHAPEQTTEEFIRETAAFSALSEDHRRRTSEFLDQSDLVKFARHTPGGPDMENAFSAAEQLVEQTRARGEETAP